MTLLETVANDLAAVPGRKNVVLISGKMFLPPDRKIWLRMLRTIIGGLAPYALDGSFVIPSKVTANAPNAARAAGEYIDQNYQWKRQLSLRLQSSLTEATGGRVFVNTNHIQGAIRTSFEDSRVTYTWASHSIP